MYKNIFSTLLQKKKKGKTASENKNQTCIYGLYISKHVSHYPSTIISGKYINVYSIVPVMLILADHLEVPSSTLCLICFICMPCVALSRANTSWISSKISGLFLSLIFMRSFRTMMMFWVRSSAPCLELFSAAPE